MVYKFTCKICGNSKEIDRMKIVPEGWFRLDLIDHFSERALTLDICNLCLPMPIKKCSIEFIMPYVRKIFSNLR